MLLVFLHLVVTKNQDMLRIAAINDKSGYPPATYHYIYKPLVVKSDYFTLRALTLSLQITAIDGRMTYFSYTFLISQF